MRLCQTICSKPNSLLPSAQQNELRFSSNRLNRVAHRPVLAQNLIVLKHPPVIHVANNTLMDRLRRQAIHSDTRHSTHSNHTRNRIALLQHASNPEADNIQALLPINNLAPIHRLKQPLLRSTLDPPRISPNPQAPKLVLLRAPEAHENKPERVDITPRLRLHELGRADARELLRRLHRITDTRLLGFLEAGVGVDGGAQGPDAAADAPAAEALEEVVRQVVEVVVLHLGDFGVRAVFLVEGAAREAVDVVDGAVREALLEDFGADEAGCAG
jgi:hypothetical protein